MLRFVGMKILGAHWVVHLTASLSAAVGPLAGQSVNLDALNQKTT